MAAGGSGEYDFVRAQKWVRMAGFAGWFTVLGHGAVVFYQMGSRRPVAAGRYLPERGWPGTGRKEAWPKKAWFTAGVPDTQRVKDAATATGAPGGFDAGKLVQGRSCLVPTGTGGNVLVSGASPADAADGSAATAFWDEVATLYELSVRARVTFVGRSFSGVFRGRTARGNGIRVERPPPVLVRRTNFCPHAWRWLAGRTFAWFKAKRRLSKACG